MQERIEAIRDLSLAKPDNALQPSQKLALSDSANELRAEAIRALASFDSPGIAKELLSGWEKYPVNLKNEVVNVLAGRKDWAKALLDAIAAKKVAQTDVYVNTILRIQALKDKNLDAQIEKVWGRVRTTPAELEAVINKTAQPALRVRCIVCTRQDRVRQSMRQSPQFEGRDYEVGPNIEGAARDIEYLLINVLDPNRVIGAPPYFMRTVTKLNGQMKSASWPPRTISRSRSKPKTRCSR